MCQFSGFQVVDVSLLCGEILLLGGSMGVLNLVNCNSNKNTVRFSLQLKLQSFINRLILAYKLLCFWQLHIIILICLSKCIIHKKNIGLISDVFFDC